MSESDIHLVRTRRAEIAQERAALDAEDNDLAVTERTLARLQAGRTAAAPQGNGAAKKLVRPAGHPSQADMIVGTLRAAESPWFESSADLREAIEVVHGVQININSFYPLLSDLKKQGVIVRDAKGRVALAKRIGLFKEAAE